jgi:hypothetical protein
MNAQKIKELADALDLTFDRSGHKQNRHKLHAAIDALLSLDAAGALVPHGIGGHARTLLTAARAAIAIMEAEPHDMERMLRNGAKAWAGVDPQSLRDGSYQPKFTQGPPADGLMKEIRWEMSAQSGVLETALPAPIAQDAVLMRQALDYIDCVPDDRYNAEHIDRSGLIAALRARLGVV